MQIFIADGTNGTKNQPKVVQEVLADLKMMIDVTFAFICVASIIFRQFWTGSSFLFRLLGNSP